MEYTRPKMNKKPPSNLLIDWICTLLICWMYAGLFVDIWGHNHLKASSLESFFTPSHYVFYSGFSALAFFYIFLGLRNYRNGYNFKNLLPVGYNFFHIVWFAVGGVFDFIWHSTFGVEKNLDALISPAHVFLGIGTTLMLTAPLRSIWGQTKLKNSLLNQLPLLICLVIIWTCYSVMTEYAHPIFQPVLSGVTFSRNSGQIFQAQGLGVASIFIQTILMVSIVYINLFKRKFIAGSFIFLFTINSGLMSMMASKSMSIDWNFVIGGFLAGLVSDLLYFFLKPSLQKPLSFQIFSFFIAFVYNLMYFFSLYLGKGFWTSIHLTTGVVFESGIIIWFYSLIILTAIKNAPNHYKD